MTVALGAVRSALIVSGPNAGGKTIALKTAGLGFCAGMLPFGGVALAVGAVTLAIQDRLLHDRAGDALVDALPPLQTMEHLLFLMIGEAVLLRTEE